MQITYDLLENIEVAITFSKLNTFHNSIIEPKDLLSEILQINNLLDQNKFPFKPAIENLLLFEKVIEIKSFSKDNQITFLIEIPIVEIESYTYYHLYPLPTPHLGSFKTIIPRSKFLVTNEHTYAFFETKCQEIIPEEFLCHEVHTSKIGADAPCEIQLLQYTINPTNCEQIATDISDIKIQKIEGHQ